MCTYGTISEKDVGILITGCVVSSPETKYYEPKIDYSIIRKYFSPFDVNYALGKKSWGIMSRAESLQETKKPECVFVHTVENNKLINDQINFLNIDLGLPHGVIKKYPEEEFDYLKLLDLKPRYIVALCELTGTSGDSKMMGLLKFLGLPITDPLAEEPDIEELKKKEFADENGKSNFSISYSTTREYESIWKHKYMIALLSKNKSEKIVMDVPSTLDAEKDTTIYNRRDMLIGWLMKECIK